MPNASFDAQTLSTSTNGMPVVVTGTSSGSPTTLHVATSTTGEVDKVYLYAANVGTTEETISLQIFDGTATRQILYPIKVGPNLGGVALIEGHLLAEGASFEAFVSSSGSFVVWGDVYRVTSQ